jgi:hypothetical protein
MKETYLVHITLPEVFSTAFNSLIPPQRELAAKLLDEQVLISYSLDMSRRNIWAFIKADDQSDLMKILRGFPVFSEVGVTVHELAFHDTAPVILPELILN